MGYVITLNETITYHTPLFVTAVTPIKYLLKSNEYVCSVERRALDGHTSRWLDVVSADYVNAIKLLEAEEGKADNAGD